MADFEKDEFELDEDRIVKFEDEEGNESYYYEDTTLSIGDKVFAILVPLPADEESCDCGDSECDCGDDVYIARIDTDENGEEIYVDPTDEEFEQVLEAYEKLFDEEESEA